MAWQIKDEWIDLSRGHHYVIFHNPEVLVPPPPGVAGKHTPVEHHLIHEFKVPACPHCGHVKQTEAGETIDFTEQKNQELAALNAHHALMMAYSGKHRGVRLGRGPKQK